MTWAKRKIVAPFIATTIAEHDINIGIAIGIKLGKLCGKIEMLEDFHDRQVISTADFKRMVTPLRAEL